jgi:hypothetical protein
MLDSDSDEEPTPPQQHSSHRVNDSLEINNNGDTHVSLTHSLTMLPSTGSLEQSSQSAQAMSHSDLRPALSLKNTQAFASFIKCTGQKVIFNDIWYVIIGI